jgi:hypothetical protein
MNDQKPDGISSCTWLVLSFVLNGSRLSIVSLSLVPGTTSPVTWREQYACAGSIHTVVACGLNRVARVSPCRLHVDEQWEMKWERAAWKSGRAAKWETEARMLGCLGWLAGGGGMMTSRGFERKEDGHQREPQHDGRIIFGEIITHVPCMG